MTVITKNAFDAGPCLVQVWTYDYPTGAPAFSATMSKGQSQSFVNPNFSGTHLTVAVDANGIVTISSADQPYYQSRYGATVTVTPVAGGVGASLTNVAGSTDPVVPVGSSIYKKFSYVSPDIPVNAGAVYLGDGSIADYAFPSMPLSAGMNFNYPGGSGSPLGATPFVLGSFALMVDYPPPVVVAPNESLTCDEYSANNAVTPVITADGSPITDSTLGIMQSPANGAASVNGATFLYTPRDGYFGYDSFTYTATYGGVTSNVATVSVTVTPAACGEIGRTTRAVGSAYYRTRVHDSRLMMGEKRCLVADFGGVISSARTIVSVTWRCDFGYIAQMSRARIQPGGRSAAVDVVANWIGDSIIRCEATLDNGEVYVQPFRVDVSGDPIFMPAVSGNGPTVLTAP